MHRVFHKLSDDFQEKHMAEQERIRNRVEKRQAGQTKDWNAGMLRITRAQRKASAIKESEDVE